MTGTVRKPARCAACQRRSPAIKVNPPLGPGATINGWINPWARIEAANSFSSSSSNLARGWRGLRWINSTGAS
jgi:hypothetical protein